NLAGQVDNLVQETQATQILGQWNDSLDALEAQHGALPPDFPRDKLIYEALERGIGDPEAAYWAVAAPARKALSGEATKARQEALAAAKKLAATTRPRADAGGGT